MTAPEGYQLFFFIYDTFFSQSLRKLQDAETVSKEPERERVASEIRFLLKALVLQQLFSVAERESENEIEVGELRV